MENKIKENLTVFITLKEILATQKESFELPILPIGKQNKTLKKDV